jgi:hypothetical protein
MTLENAQKFAEEAKSYKRYMLTKPYKTKINTGGALGAFAEYSKKVGDVVEGLLTDKDANEPSLREQTLRVPVGQYTHIIGGATPYVYIPLSYLKPEPMTIKQPIAEVIQKKTEAVSEFSSPFMLAGNAFGTAYGLYFAYSRKSSFWGYLGWAILFGAIGGSVGAGINYTIKSLKQD